MKVLRIGSKGADVKRWQNFLIGQGAKIRADGRFGRATADATKRFQRSEPEIHVVDGIVGNQTLAVAMMSGFEALDTDASTNKASAGWPPPPKKLRPITDARRKKLLGEFNYTPNPTSRNPEKVVVDPRWVRENIIRVKTPRLASRGVVRFNKRPVTSIRMHRVVAPHFEALIEAWDKADLLHLIKTWDGDYYPRFIRGSKTRLSNHSYGSAFDINRAWNRLGAVPELRGHRGSVRELVPLANKHGFYWGGHYRNRKDGMHFEFVGR